MCLTNLQDHPLDQMDLDDYVTALGPKVHGTVNLNDAFASPNLEFFITLSSITCILGKTAQANYSAGNAFQDAFARTNAGKSHTRYISLNLGAIDGSEAITSLPIRQQELMRHGAILMTFDELYKALEYAMSAQAAKDGSVQSIMGFDRQSMTAVEDGFALTNPLFSMVPYSRASRDSEDSDHKFDVEKALRNAKFMEEAEAIITDAIVDKVAIFLNCLIEDVSKEQSLVHFGMDSLVSIELRNWMVRTCQATLMISELTEAPSILALSKTLARRSRLISDSIRSEALQEEVNKETVQSTPFSLMLGLDIGDLRRQAAQLCKISAEQIEDIYPCTALQTRWIVGFERSPSEPRDYQTQAVFSLPPSIDLEKFQAVWCTAFRRHAILRTRFININSRVFQVVVDDNATWERAELLQPYLQRDRHDNMEFGDKLVRFAIVEPKDTEERYFVFSAHHSTYDGFSYSFLFGEVEAAYFEGFLPTPAVEMGRYIKYCMEADKAAAIDFWTSHLAGAVTGPILGDRRLDRNMMVNQSPKRLTIDLPKLRGLEITLPTMIEVAVGLVFARDSKQTDVILRANRAGRDVPVPQIEELVGPVATTIPVRIHMDPGQKVKDLLQTVQSFQSALVPHQHLGYFELMKLTHLKNILEHPVYINIIPHGVVGLGQRLGLELKDTYMRSGGASYGVVANIERGKLRLTISSDDEFLPVELVKKQLDDIKRVLLLIFDVYYSQPDLSVNDLLSI